MKFLKPTMIIFTVLTALFACLGIAQLCGFVWPTEFGVADWIASFALGIFCVTVVVGMCGHKFDVKKLGSYLLHFGLIIFLLGGLLYAATGIYVVTPVPVDKAPYDRVGKTDGTILELGFTFSLDDFQIEYYEPVYDIYLMTETGTKTIKTDITLSKNDEFDFGKYGGKYKLSSLIQNGSVREQINLGKNYVAILRMPVKKYTAVLTFYEDGKNVKKQLIVNYPVRKNGFKIYLMSYNEKARTATLLFKRDIGEVLSTGGAVAIMIGSLFHCLVYPAIEKTGFNLLKRKGAKA